jgi:acetyl-CoA decarbonylase/synthase complex subunit gamma
MKAGCRSRRLQAPLIYGATADNVDAMGALAQDNDLPVAIKADSVEALIAA